MHEIFQREASRSDLTEGGGVGWGEAESKSECISFLFLAANGWKEGLLSPKNLLAELLCSTTEQERDFFSPS